MENILQKSNGENARETGQMGEKLLNVIFVFGMIYGNLCNYINKVNLL